MICGLPGLAYSSSMYITYNPERGSAYISLIPADADFVPRREVTLEEVEDGTRLLVRESTPEFSTALELRALALSYA